MLRAVKQFFALKTESCFYFCGYLWGKWVYDILIPMKRYDEFEFYHPIVNLIYFASVIVLCMVALHPLVQFMGLTGSFSYLLYLRGRSAFKPLLFSFITAMGAAIFNVLFNHRGATILAYFSNGNPLTLESVTHGLALGSSLACILLWFACFNLIFTSDRLICLTGRFSPTLSLLITITLRFVPLYLSRLRRAATDRRVFYGEGILRGLKTIETVSAQVLESAVETADIMRCRGLGLKGRTAFSPFIFRLRDVIALVFIVLLAALAFLLAPKAEYLPVYTSDNIVPAGVLATAVLMLLPTGLNLIYGEIKWRHLK